MSLQFSIVIPCHNEADNIIPLIDEINFYLSSYDYEIIVINDFSTDNTFKIISKKMKMDKKIKLINNKNKIGQSFSIIKGIKSSKYSIIVTLDGDGQNNPVDIFKLIDVYNKNSDCFMVGGIRLKRKDNLIKLISSKAANFIRSKVLKDNCRDTGCALKVFDKSIFLKFPCFDGLHRFLPAFFNAYSSNNIYIEVDHRSRNFGNSKYGISNRLFRGLRDLIKVYIMIKKIKNKDV